MSHNFFLTSPLTLFLAPTQIRPFLAEDDLDRERDRAETDADQDRTPHRRVQYVQNPLRQVAAERDQIFSERDAAHHDDHRRNEQHGRLATPRSERPIGCRGDEECEDGKHGPLQWDHHEVIDPPKGRHGDVDGSLSVRPQADRNGTQHAYMEDKTIAPSRFFAPDLDGMDVEEAADSQYQREPPDDLEPLGDGGEHLLRGRVRHIILRREHDAGDERDQKRDLPAKKDHFMSLNTSRNNCGHSASSMTPRVASTVPMPSTPRMSALPISCPRSVPT